LLFNLENRRKLCVPEEHQSYIELHGNKMQETILFIVTALKTSDPIRAVI
jgi:hypothetical protein